MKPVFIHLLMFVSLTGFSQTTISTIKVNEQRIEKRIFELAKFGKDSSGNSYRVAYTKGDQQGREYFISLMKKAGLEVTIDYAGNIIGRRKGMNASLKSIALGSHIDMVPRGGNYDGCVGSVGALEVIEVLNENNMLTEHPLELIIFSNEEGGTIGSSMLVKPYSVKELKAVSQSGLTIAEGLKAIGGNPDSLQKIVRNKG
ncbi:MAG: M20/M25/M40 family metallo-hydrolase, partial [Sphingobacteriales bacterium]